MFSTPYCLFYFFTLGSLSPIWDSLVEEPNAEAIRSALHDVASSSKITKRPTGWTSSDDEADTMDLDNEGISLHPVLLPFLLSISLVY